jgi:hypothetical protein
MIVGNQWVPGLAQEQRFFHRAHGVLVKTGRLTPQSRLLIQSVGDGEAIVIQEDTMFSLERHGASVELFDEMGRSIGRWLV